VNPRLYIGNLPPTVTEAELQTLFSRVGAVTGVQMVLDPTTQQSRGYAFVTMASPELAETALRDFHSYSLGGRYITVTEARPPQEPKGMMSEGFGSRPATPFKPAENRNKGFRRSGRRRGR
jgi:cold-inducible RNA-binding protein